MDEGNVVRLRFSTFQEAQENERAILQQFGEQWERAFKIYDDAMAKIAADSDALAKFAPGTVTSLFIRLSKVDVAKRLVYGTAAIEQSSKLELEKWSEGFEKATGGKSKGNVRSMDGKVAAGRLIHISFDDKRNEVGLAAHIVDAGEWHKVTEGVYTGFTTSAAGISLADMPLAPDAAFAVIKNDGGEELRKFAPQPEWRRIVQSFWADVETLKKGQQNTRSMVAIEEAKQAAILLLASNLSAAVKSRDERLYGAAAVAKRSLRFARANPVAFYGHTNE